MSAGTWTDAPLAVVAYRDNLIYAGTADGLLILDVSDPSSVIQIGAYDVEGASNDIVLEGDLAFLSQGFYDLYGIKGVSIIDVSDPTAPTGVGFYPTQYNAASVAIRDHHAYLLQGDFAGRGTGDLEVLDIANPTHPTRIGLHDNPGEGDVVLGPDREQDLCSQQLGRKSLRHV